MKVGDRVEVKAQWSSFFGYRGVVTATRPHLMITIAGDTYPIRFAERELAVIAVEPHIGGAE